MRCFVYLIVFLIASVNAGSYCFQKLTDAQAAFNLALNITGADWNSADSLGTQIYTHYMNDPPNGMRTVCTASNSYKNVLGDDYMTCFDPLQLIRSDNGTLNVSLSNAFNYFSVMTQFDFTCGAGFGIFANDLTKCLPNIFANSTEALKNCQLVFNYQVTNGDPKMICAYVTTLIECYTNTFQVCGDIGTFFGCEYVRTSVIFLYPTCNEVSTNCMVNNLNH